MVESNLLVDHLKSEKDWNMAAVFSDNEKVLVSQKCNLLPAEIK